MMLFVVPPNFCISSAQQKLVVTRQGECALATGNEVETYTLLTLCRLAEGYPLLASLERFQPLALPLCKQRRKDLSRVFTIYMTCNIISYVKGEVNR